MKDTENLNEVTHPEESGEENLNEVMSVKTAHDSKDDD